VPTSFTPVTSLPISAPTFVSAHGVQIFK
jgi:hypothetical protein